MNKRPENPQPDRTPAGKTPSAATAHAAAVSSAAGTGAAGADVAAAGAAAAASFWDDPLTRARIIEGSILVGLCAWIFLAGCTPLRDTDLWWHLKTGQQILARGQLPAYDWYTFTDGDRRWIDLHWGFQLIVWAAYCIGGVNLIILLKSLVLSVTVFIGWRASGTAVSPWVKGLLWIPACICISGRGFERPEMFSMLLLAVSLWIVSTLPREPFRIWWFTPLFVLWVNLHSLFVLGAVVAVCYALDQVVRFAIAGELSAVSRSPQTAPAKPPAILFKPHFGFLPADGLQPSALLIAALAAAAACFCNPYFDEGALFPLTVLRKFTTDREVFSSIGEFLRPIDFVMGAKLKAFYNPYFCAELLAAILLVLSFLPVWLRGRISVLRLLLAAGFLWLAWSAVRNTNVFALIAVVVSCWNLGEAATLAELRRQKHTPLDPLASTDNINQTASDIAPALSAHAQRTARGVALVPAVLVSAFIWLWCGSVVSNVWATTVYKLSKEKRYFRLGEAPAWFPHAACQFATQPGFPMRCFAHHQGVAAVYEFHANRGQLVFTDPRLEVCSTPTALVYRDVQHNMMLIPPSPSLPRGLVPDPRFAEFMRDSNGDLPVFILDSRVSRPLIQGLMNLPNYRLVFAEPAAGVFLETRKAEQLGLKKADPTPLEYPPD